jgi:hypothetical protein
MIFQMLPPSVLNSCRFGKQGSTLSRALKRVF